MSSTVLDSRTASKTERPKRYTVVFLNDDFTPMDFVVAVLQRFLGLDVDKAVQVTLDIHKKGRGAVGLYPFEVAETKAIQIMDAAKAYEFPLTCRPETA